MDPRGFQSYLVRWSAARNELLATLRAEQRPRITSQFPFEKLPPEIRNAIYHLHLVQAKGLTRLRKWDDRLDVRAHTALHHKLNNPSYMPPLFKYTALSILGASRQLQQEALGIFYYHNTFRFKRVTDLRDFLSSIGSERRAFVRNIWFSYRGHGSPAAFKLLATCNNLTKLHIQLHVMTLRYARRKQLLAAVGISHLLKIRGLAIVDFSQYGPLLADEYEGFEETVRNALLQPRKVIKGEKRAANRKQASKGKNVGAGKKRTVEDGEAQKTKKAKLVHDGIQIADQAGGVAQDA